MSPKWQERFGRFDRAEPFGYLKFRDPSQLKLLDKHSVWGFLFGPFFYLSKGLYKKGLVILSGIFLFCSLLDLIAYQLGITIDNKLYAIPGEVACSLCVNFDLYLFHRRNETMWSFLKVLDSWSRVLVLTSASLGLFLVCAFTLTPQVNDYMVEAVSGSWENDLESLNLGISLKPGEETLRINEETYRVRIRKADVDSLVLATPWSGKEFPFQVVWDSTEQSFRLKWIAAAGKEVLLDYLEPATP